SSYDGSGTRTVRYVRDSLFAPVAIGIGTGTPEPRDDVFSDHLNVPRTVTDGGLSVTWRSSYEAFGGISLEPPSSITLDVRLPGQLLDSRTGLHYNFLRDYDPARGRYLQTDPLGIAGGVNAYAYVEGNPVILIDPYALDAIEINYDYYPVNTGLGFNAPLGHAAAVSVDPSTGRTRYYEFGRYSDKKCGNVRRQPVPDLTIGPDGAPTTDSLDALYSYASSHYGHGSHVSATYYPNTNYQSTIAYAEGFSAHHPCYSLFGNNCKTFAHDAATATCNPDSCSQEDK